MKLNPNETSNTVGLQNISMKINVLEEDLNAYIPVVQENFKRLSEALQLETNTSHLSELQNISKKITELYSVRLEDRALLNEIDTALGKLDTDVYANIYIMQNNTKRLSTIEMGILQLEANQTQNKMNLHDMSKWINETESNFAVHVATIQENSNKLSNVEDKLAEETYVLRNLSLGVSSKNEEHSNEISQLESDMETLFQNQTSRIAQLELDKTANHIVIQLHGDKVEDLERNLTSAYSVITTNTENILTNSDNLRRVENITSAQHANLLLHADRLTQLESFRADDQNTTQAHGSRVTALEIIQIMIKDTLQNHSFRLGALESEPALDQGTIVNQTLRLELLETNMQDLNKSLQNEMSIIEDLDAGLVQVQLDTNTALQDHSDKLTKLTGKHVI